ncbi:hypothetical protein [Streptomyces nanshensis]|uniref:hypothetical protein n=1 Tax=Streptomyces nanshensis TaxID=518642 RepID=UPI00085C981A|nr:hypothetical protein [Streptomyces nanshensis]
MGTTIVLRRTHHPAGDKTAKSSRDRTETTDGRGRARYEITGALLEDFGGRVYLDRELPPGGVKAYKTARKQGVRSIGMWTDPHRRHRWARIVTTPATGGAPQRYEVYGGEQEHLLGSIQRERSFTAGHLRTRWLLQPQGQAAAVGYKGRLAWWCIWYLIFPVQCVLGVASLIGGGDLFRTPRRTGYRRNGTRILDYGRGLQDHFRLTATNPEDWDPRLLAALLALHTSHDGITGDSWDAGAPDPDEQASPGTE